VLRYTVSLLLLLLLAMVVQQFLPALPGLRARFLLVPLVFLCAAVTVDLPAMLLLAFVGGFLWDAQNALGPSGGDPEVYAQVGMLRFGYSIVLYAMMGLLMQGVRPWFQRGRWQISVAMAGFALFFYLLSEYLLLAFIRGGLNLGPAIIRQVALSSAMTMFFAPLVLLILSRLERLFGLQPEYQTSRGRAYR
jgi:hypothetical protein